MMSPIGFSFARMCKGAQKLHAGAQKEKGPLSSRMEGLLPCQYPVLAHGNGIRLNGIASELSRALALAVDRYVTGTLAFRSARYMQIVFCERLLQSESSRLHRSQMRLQHDRLFDAQAERRDHIELNAYIRRVRKDSCDQFFGIDIRRRPALIAGGNQRSPDELRIVDIERRCSN